MTVWDSPNLHGAVKIVVTRAYKVTERDGKTERGVRSVHPDDNKTFRFDSAGLLSSIEYFSGGDLTGWNEYRYDVDGRLAKILYHSVFFNADSVSTVEWLDDKDYIRRTCNEAGTEIAEERFSRRGNRSYRTVLAGGDTSTVNTLYRRQRPVKVEHISAGNVSKMKYVYDNKGNESRIENYVNGERSGITEIGYNGYDEAGNWTERTIYSVEERDLRVPLQIEVREIEYY